MDPKIWGPPAWIFIHSVTFAYPETPTEDHKKGIKYFFHSLRYVLPCEKCKVHYNKYLDEHPLTDTVLSTKKGVSIWAFDFHNDVNKRTGGKVRTYDEYIDEFMEIYKKKPQKDYSIYIILFVIVVFFLLLFREKIYSALRRII